MSVVVVGAGAVRRARSDYEGVQGADGELPNPKQARGADAAKPAVSWVIVFLAHDGVHQVGAWDAWREKSGHKDEVAFSVRAPATVAQGGHFCRLNAPSSRARAMGATSWCSPSVAFEIVEALRDARADYPHALKYTLVSGTCCPVKPLKQAYAQIFKDPAADNICGNVDPVEGVPTVFTTWLTYTARTLDAIVKHTDEHFGEWALAWYGTASKCSEEVYFPAVLAALRDKGLYASATDFRRFCISWDPRGAQTSSPDEWADFTTLHQLRDAGNPKHTTCSKQVNLVDLLLSMRLWPIEMGGGMFVRKILSSADVGAHPVLPALLYDESLDDNDVQEYIKAHPITYYTINQGQACVRTPVENARAAKYYQNREVAFRATADMTPAQLRALSKNYDMEELIKALSL